PTASKHDFCSISVWYSLWLLLVSIMITCMMKAKSFHSVACIQFDSKQFFFSYGLATTFAYISPTRSVDVTTANVTIPYTIVWCIIKKWSRYCIRQSNHFHEITVWSGCLIPKCYIYFLSYCIYT